MATDKELETVARVALAMLKRGPKDLVKCMLFAAESNNMDLPDPAALLAARTTATQPNDPVLNLLAFKIHDWDSQDDADWTAGTAPHTQGRRSLILRLLAVAEPLVTSINEAIPLFSRAERSTVVALAHAKWYGSNVANSGSFYWNAYVNQLLPPRGRWSSSAVSTLHDGTSNVVARLSDPTRSEIYQVKGLVVGYVQSGKTAHFTGVIAKAADAGYRLIIVLAGTLNILRRQTQRRLDKDLVGQELLAGDEYSSSNDWDEFVKHGRRPSEAGSFDWERLTNLEDDYAPLGARLGALRFQRSDPSKPLNHENNLRFAPARLIVIKKIPNMIRHLAKDLKVLQKQGNNLDQIPTLIIDDESDQASVNTINTLKIGNEKKRTSTNNSIIDLLTVLPRSQYVGYTATPFANVFVDPSDAEQLFPKDFIISLPRPSDYMGVADFFDFNNTGDSDQPGPNERAFVRNVVGADDLASNLPQAIDSFILAGAIKLFRMAKAPDRYRYKHHTMLVHHSSARKVHQSTADHVQSLFDNGSFTSAKGRIRLRTLLRDDFGKHCDSTLPFPSSFEELEPFVGACLAKVRAGKPVRIVNGDDDNVEDTPDFESDAVWAILVGGAKLSRGYTVEGLTTTYYRRIANAADTLMQMGRWFGFRPGYTDVVRWFIGRNEPVGRAAKRHVDLYEQFGAICRDEEAFRSELTKYAEDDSIRPAQVPPLVHSHLPSLKPTPRNKMYNAVLTFKNLSEKWSEKTLVSDKDAAWNNKLATRLLSGLNLERSTLSLTSAGGANAFQTDAYCGLADGADVTAFLREFRWASEANPIYYELEYISGKHGDPAIQDWLVILPQTQAKPTSWDDVSLPSMTIVERARIDDSNGRFKVFSDPIHVKVADCVAGSLGGGRPSDSLNKFRSATRAVLVMYRVRPRNNLTAPVSIGFGLKFPTSTIAQIVAWTAHDVARLDAVVIPTK